MPQTRYSRFFPPEWDLPQDTLNRCSEDLTKRLRGDLADLYEYGFDKSIPYLAEYQEIAVSRIKSGNPIPNDEISFLHDRIGFQLAALTEDANTLRIGYDNPSKLPKRRGLYFCARFALDSMEIWYVGRTKSFRSRWEDHHKFEVLQAIKDVSVYCLPLDSYSDEDLNYAERAYIYMLKPVFNGTSYPDRYLRVPYYR